MDILNALNAEYLEEQIRRYQSDPNSVEPSICAFFEGEGSSLVASPVQNSGPSFSPTTFFHSTGSCTEANHIVEQQRLVQLVHAYRLKGHLKATIDPLGVQQRKHAPTLDPSYWGFSEGDLKRTFSTQLLNGPDSMQLKDVVDFLERTYARSIGCEFMHISDNKATSWLTQRIELRQNKAILSYETQLFILDRLCAAEAFEDFLHLKFLGAKRFSLEGAEALIPMLALLIEEASVNGVQEVVLGMAHRGRLNVLVNLGCKDRKAVFREFADVNPSSFIGRGDVKYHLGCDTQLQTREGEKVQLSMMFNPSHLEFINPVTEGVTRARQEESAAGKKEIMPVLIHGDAAFMGQGVVAETLNLMNLQGYSTGGTIHIIVNNQIGFTTLPSDSRSTTYCSDIAKMLDVPIFHVNGEDPEAVVQTMKIAAEFRQKFHRDVIIDMVCFRKYGHNESDEPRFTQPLMYKEIEAHPPTHKVYAERLKRRGNLKDGEVDAIYKKHVDKLTIELEEVMKSLDKGLPQPSPHAPTHLWNSEVDDVDTTIPQSRAVELMQKLAQLPEGFTPHRVLKRLMKTREQMARGEKALDWGAGEGLAFASLLVEGFPIRVTGQDSRRGTFSHRHYAITDQKTAEVYCPHAHLSEEQAPIRVFNSPLSETAVLGFEFGYALERPKGLTIWEAQFGDFANGAQVIIDQFLASSEEKWSQRSPIVLLLPHGYEGQGPDHSSARLERFLQLCAKDNLQICNLTTPAQIFHVLRRQVLREYPKPLVIFSPKSLLRHRRATSTFEALALGGFEKVIQDPNLDKLQSPKRIVICSGKVYYDLLEEREARAESQVALLRLEQLYPFPIDELRSAIGAIPSATEVVWCQEEPANMGGLSFFQQAFAAALPDLTLGTPVSRQAAASTATGSPKAHRIEQQALLDRALSL